MEAGLNPAEDTKNWQAGNELGQELKMKPAAVVAADGPTRHAEVRRAAGFQLMSPEKSQPETRRKESARTFTQLAREFAPQHARSPHQGRI